MGHADRKPRSALPVVLSSVLAALAGCTQSNPAYVGLPDGGMPGSYLTSDTGRPDEEPGDPIDAPPALDAPPMTEPDDDGPSVDTTTVAVGTGLRGDYFDGSMLELGDTGTLDMTRVDPTIDFDWGTGRADGRVDSDWFSVRWTGQVMPRYSETYTFTTVTDEGVRLWVDGVELINQWVDQAGIAHSGQIALVANRRYDIRLEYYEATGNAMAKLYWSSASQANEIIPSSQLFEP